MSIEYVEAEGEHDMFMFAEYGIRMMDHGVLGIGKPRSTRD